MNRTELGFFEQVAAIVALFGATIFALGAVASVRESAMGGLLYFAVFGLGFGSFYFCLLKLFRVQIFGIGRRALTATELKVRLVVALVAIVVFFCLLVLFRDAILVFGDYGRALMSLSGGSAGAVGGTYIGGLFGSQDSSGAAGDTA